ncbi:MAG: phage shock protein PspA [Pseudomonadota bacterium]
MGIFSRLTDIINSNISDVLDRAEDPKKMVRMVIQEMEDTLVEVRTSAAKTIADRKDIERQIGRMEKAQQSWAEKAELALRKNREDLAKGALIEKAQVADMVEVMREELGILNDGLERHEEDIQKLEAKLTEAKAKQQTLLARQETANSRLKVRKQVFSSKMDDAFARFDRLERRVDLTEGMVDSYDLSKHPGKTLDQELSDLQAEDGVQEELEALKRKVAGSNSRPMQNNDAA